LFILFAYVALGINSAGLCGEKMHSKQLFLFLISILAVFALGGCASQLDNEQAIHSGDNFKAGDNLKHTPVNATSGKKPNKKQPNAHQSLSIASGQPPQKLTASLLYDLMLAELAMQRGDYALAFKQYYHAAEKTRDSRLAKKATRVTLFSKDDEQTFKAVELWSEIQPDNIDVQLIFASSLLAKKKDTLAMQHLQKVVALSDDFSEGFKRSVSTLSAVDDKDRANRLFEQLAKNYAGKPLVKFYQAKLAFKFSDYLSAETYLEQFLAVEPNNTDALLLKVDLLKKQNKSGQAIKILDELVSKQPDNTSLRLELSRLLVRSKQYKQAAQHIQVLAKKDLPPEILFTISLLSIEMNQLDEAKQFLQRLNAYRLYASESAYFIGQLEASRKNYVEAEKWFKQVKNGKYTFEAFVGLVMVYAQQEKFAQALGLLEHSTASKYHSDNIKRSTDLLQIKAEVYSQAKDYTKAYDSYTEALSLAPDNHDIRYNRAMLAEKFGRIDLLEKDLQTIISADPKDNQALNALGYTLADRTTRYQEARQYIERALLIDPNDIATLDSMGWVLYKMGKHKEALNYLKKAYDKEQDAEIAAHYGEVLWVSGQTQYAKKIWQKALKKEPGDQLLTSVMARYLKNVD